ncbi:MAG: hypothetical protein IKJ65_02910 [Clostridia bacterium]|nr:hypothetical protein [Clostridia bacterium]
MRKWMNRILAMLFLLFIAVMFLVTMVKEGELYAYGFFKSYKSKLTEDATLFDDLRARISKLEYNTRERLFLKDEMRLLNARFQKLIGKDVYDVGGKDTIRLTNGAFYDMFTQESTDEKMLELIDFSKKLKADKNIDTAFVYCHCGVYEENLLPEKYRVMDGNNAFADRVTETMAASGISVTDSRDAYVRANLAPDQAIMYSDIHWTHRMALETAYDAVINMNKDLGLNLDETALLYDRFTDEVHEKLLLGEIGVRLGENIVPKDDVHVLYPNYETDLIYKSEKDGVITERAGAFEETVVERDKLSLDGENDYSITAYYVYGDYLATLQVVNENAPDKRVLVFKDSYGTPVSAFLTLAAREVVSVDLRSTTLSIEEVVNQVNPDVVVFAYSQQMLRKFDYEIAE